MNLTDQHVLDAINGLLDRERVSATTRDHWLRVHRHDVGLQEMWPLIDRYLKIVDPPRMCQVTHDHWEGPMACGSPMPCPKHGGR